MSEEIITAFEKDQADLIDRFKDRMKDACEDVLATLYCDVLNYADTDANTNYRNYLRNKFRESFRKEIAEDYNHYSWAHDIRMLIYNEHKEQLQNKIIEDLQDRIKSLEDHIEQLRKWR